MANVMTDQLLGTLLGQRRSPVRDAADDELLDAPPPIRGSLPEALGMVAPAAPAQETPPPSEPVATVGPGTMSEPARPAPSRVDQLLSTLQRPGRGDHSAAAFFDSLFGGDNYTSDVRARRNQFDQALIGAQAADAGAAERAGEAEAGRAMQREQMGLTQRAQDLANERAEETRRFQEAMLAQRQGFTAEENAKNREAQMARAKLGPHHGGSGAPATPEARAEREAVLADMEASYLAGAASTPGKKSVTIEQAKAFKANPNATAEEIGVAPEQLEMLRRSDATLRGLKVTDGKAYAQLIKGGEARETGTGDAIGKGVEAKRLDPKQRLLLRQEVSDVGSDINDARQAWKSMSDTAKKVFAKYAGAGGDLAQTIKSARLSPEDQKYAGQLQSLANVLIKARSGSAVTGSEWNRVAQEIGWPTGDWSFFNSTAGIDGFLNKSSRAWTRRVNNIKSEYGDIWGSDG